MNSLSSQVEGSVCLCFNQVFDLFTENEIEHQEVEKALSLVKDVISEVNNKVKNYEKKTRLYEVYNKTDSKSIQRMKSGQMFAKEDLKRRKLVRDGVLFLRSSPANRIKG